MVSIYNNYWNNVIYNYWDNIVSILEFRKNAVMSIKTLGLEKIPGYIKKAKLFRMQIIAYEAYRDSFKAILPYGGTLVVGIGVKRGYKSYIKLTGPYPLPYCTNEWSYIHPLLRLFPYSNSRIHYTRLVIMVQVVVV